MRQQIRAVAFRFLVAHFMASVWLPESGGKVTGGAVFVCAVSPETQCMTAT